MSLDAFGIPALIANTAGAMLFKDATRTRSASQTSDGRGGFIAVTETEAIRALVVDYSDYLKTVGGISSDERKIIVQGEGLDAPIEQGETITIDGRSWSVLDVSLDPAGAVYEARCRAGAAVSLPLPPAPPPPPAAISASLAKMLGEIGVSSSAGVRVSTTSGVSLGALDVSSSAGVRVSASAGATLGALLAASSGAVATAAAVLPLDTKMVFVGDSFTASDNLFNWTWQLIRLSSGRFYYPINGNQGVGGNTSAQMLTRIADIKTAASGGFAFITGFENDLAQGFTAQESIDNYNAMIAALTTDDLANGFTAVKAVITAPVAPTRSVILNSANAAKKATIDAAMAAHANPLVHYNANAWDGMELSDGTGDGTTGADSHDGVHPNSQGNLKLAQNQWVFIETLCEAGDAFDAMAGYAEALGAQGDFPGDQGNGLATGWSFTNGTDATVTLSKGTLDGHPAQVITITGANTLTGFTTLLESMPLAFAVGNKMGASGRIQVTNATEDGPPVGLRSLGVSSYYGKAEFLAAYYDQSNPVLQLAPGMPYPWKGVIRAKPFAATGSGSSLDWRTAIRLYTGAVSVRIAVAQAHAYNLSVAA